MKDNNSAGRKALLAGIVVIAGIWLAPGVVESFSNAQPLTYTNCETRVVPFETEYIGDKYAENGTYEEVITEGEDGLNEVCHPNKEGYPDQLNVKTVPTNKVIEYKENVQDDEPIYTAPRYEYSGGAICMDGTRSYSTGRGTCSWHGGVDYWL